MNRNLQCCTAKLISSHRAQPSRNSRGSLVRANKLRARENMVGHRLFKSCLRGRAEIRKLHVERVQLVKVSMPTNWRTRPSIAGAFPVIQAFSRPRWQIRP